MYATSPVRDAPSALHALRRKIGILTEEDRYLAASISIAPPVDQRLPYRGLPAGCVHEVKARNLANAIAFSAILGVRLASRKQEGGRHIAYLTPDRSLHPLGLLSYGVDLGQLVHVSAIRTQDLSWTLLECLRCSSISVVIALISGLGHSECRRLQLAAESSGATAFLIGPSNSAPNASPTTRWHVTPLVNHPLDRRFDEPAWNLDLLYCTGGRTGKWTLEWRDKQLQALER